MHKKILLVFLLSACNGNFSTDSTSSTQQDSGNDFSQHGISNCTQGSTFVCEQDGPHSFTQSQQCVNVNGEVVTLNGPEPIDENLVDACPTPEPAVITAP